MKENLLFLLVVSLPCVAPLNARAQAPQLLAHYTFDGTTNDSTGNSAPMELRNAPLINNALYLNGVYEGAYYPDGFHAVARITGFSYNSFTVGMEFAAASYTNNNILTGGTWYRWFSLRHNAGRLEVTLNNQSLVYLLPTSKLKTNEWQSVICSVDASAKRIITVLNGQRLDDIFLSPTFRFDVIGSPEDIGDRHFTFANYGNGSVFHGFADNLKVWNRALTSSEIDALIAPPLPTVQMCIRRLANRLVSVSWGPTQAILQCSANVTGPYTNVPGATPPYQVDTRLAPRQFYRGLLQVTVPTLFIWNDMCGQAGRPVLDWTPRDWRLQQTTNFTQWQETPSTPPNGWYYPNVPLEVPSSPRGVRAGLRGFRIVPRVAGSSGLAGGPIYSVNIVAIGYANFRVGGTNLFSYPFVNPDRRLNAILPFGAEAEGTLLFFFDPATQTWGEVREFAPELGGWVNEFFEPALWPANRSACLIIPRSSVPGVTAITTQLAGEVPQGSFQRTLPPGMSLNGPLIPAYGGITSAHKLFPNEGDQVLLLNVSAQNYETYEFLAGAWFPSEPVIGAMDAFFYVNNNGPLNWTAVYQPQP